MDQERAAQRVEAKPLVRLVRRAGD